MGQYDKIKVVIKERMSRNREYQQERMELQRRIEENPFDEEANKKIEEIIRQENVQNNFRMAQDYNPELFDQIDMLYIECEINKVKMQAFVDSGAQCTIIS